MKIIKVEKIDNTLPSKFINNEGLNVAIINAQLATALQQMSKYTVINKNTNIKPGEIYYIGICGGHYIYVDPNLKWDNTIITLVENLEDYNYVDSKR